MAQQIGLELHDAERKMMWVASVQVRPGCWKVSKKYESLGELGKLVDEYIAIHPNALVNIYRRSYFE